MSKTVNHAGAAALLCPAWLSEVLEGKGIMRGAVSVSTQPLAFAGAVGEVIRVRLDYAETDAAGPRTMIAKVRGSAEAQIALDEAIGLCRREGRFYAELAERLPIRAPECYYPGDGITEPLLLQDLGGLEMGDQLVGLTWEQATTTIDRLADLHLVHWDADVDMDWLATPGQGIYKELVPQLVAAAAPAVLETFAGKVAEETLAGFEALVPRWGEVLARCVEGPQTIVHNDCRLDNIFFDAEAPVFIDWQLVARSRGTHDVANLLAGSMESNQLRECWEPLLRRYYDRLIAGGVTGYSWQDCVEHYRQSTLYPLGAAIPLLGSLAIEDERSLGKVIVGRALVHTADVGAFTTL